MTDTLPFQLCDNRSSRDTIEFCYCLDSKSAPSFLYPMLYMLLSHSMLEFLNPPIGILTVAKERLYWTLTREKPAKGSNVAVLTSRYIRPKDL